MGNCPNCGAPVTSYKCSYCGTLFEQPNEIILYADNKAIVRLIDDGIMTRDEARSYLKGE